MQPESWEVKQAKSKAPRLGDERRPAADVKNDGSAGILSIHFCRNLHPVPALRSVSLPREVLINPVVGESPSDGFRQLSCCGSLRLIRHLSRRRRRSCHSRASGLNSPLGLGAASGSGRWRPRCTRRGFNRTPWCHGEKPPGGIRVLAAGIIEDFDPLAIGVHDIDAVHIVASKTVLPSGVKVGPFTSTHMPPNTPEATTPR